MYPRPPRRQFFRTLLQYGFLLTGAGLSACGDQMPKDTTNSHSTGGCDDLSGLSEQDLKVRENFGYLPKSPVADNQCSNCNLWLPNEADPTCGKCLLFKGPVYAAGHCTYWAPQS